MAWLWSWPVDSSGEGPDTYFCGGQGPIFDIQISALCIGHRAVHELFDDPNPADNFTDAATGEELDTFAIPEAMDPAYASGFGDLTVHEVATDPNDPSLMYLSYYSGGLRALQIQCSNPADTSTCELVEVGGYLDPDGNNFWGVEALDDPHDDPNVQGDETLILASDRDSGLFIFQDP